MFRMPKTKESFKWKVSVNVPKTDGEFETQVFWVSFFYKSDEELKDLSQRTDPEFFNEVTDILHDFTDSDNNVLEANLDGFKVLCSNGRIKNALIKSYYEFNNGTEKN